MTRRMKDFSTINQNFGRISRSIGGTELGLTSMV